MTALYSAYSILGGGRFEEPCHSHMNRSAFGTAIAVLGSSSHSCMTQASDKDYASALYYKFMNNYSLHRLHNVTSERSSAIGLRKAKRLLSEVSAS
jgi:hypothetical protein